MNYYKIFVSILGEPHNSDKLKEYINFVENQKKIVIDSYHEDHHLLPVSLFGDYKFDIDNIFRLLYNDHIKAHVLLTEAYPIREFLRPLNFMLPRSERESKEYRKKISTATKISWKKFKKTEQYQLWRKAHSEKMSIKMKNGLASSLSNKRFSIEGEKEKVSEQFKKLWKDPLYRKNIIESLSKEKNTPEGKKRMKIAAKKNWDNRSEEDKDAFKKKMAVINKDPEKRKKAGEKIKSLWADPDHRKKILDGRKNSKKWNDARKRAGEKLKHQHLNWEILECPYCGKQSKGKGCMKRWHFENCKHKSTEKK